MHWWNKAALAVRRHDASRFGFVTTNSITQLFSRRVIAKHISAKNGVYLRFAIPDHPWIDAKDGAAVRIAMTVAAAGEGEGILLHIIDESAAPERVECSQTRGNIGSDLRTGTDLTATRTLKANAQVGSRGVQLMGDGFIVTPDQAASLDPRSLAILRGREADIAPRIRSGFGNEPQVIFDYRNGRDLTARPREALVIDLFGLSQSDVRDDYPAIYQYLMSAIRPQRDGQVSKSGTADAQKYAQDWWLFGKTRPEIRKALVGVNRYIATVETAKHRIFQFLPISTVPDNRIVCFAMQDGFHLGVLSSKIHVTWTMAVGGLLEDRPIYTKSLCFDHFPFPIDVLDRIKDCIRTEVEALDALRKRVLEEHDDLTLTGLYNVLEALRAADRNGPALTPDERDIHDRGLVTLIRQHHDAIDAFVAEAYGWDEDHAAGRLTDEEILVRLVALNKERAAEEARGLVRYLRPEFQDPGYRAPIDGTLDLGEAAAPLPDNVIPWPTTLTEQVGAVQSILAAAPMPLAAQDIARSFKGKRAATVRPVLDALAGLGMARRLEDGRYAA